MAQRRSVVTAEGATFKNLHNFRDVGRTINQLSGKTLLEEGRLFRSARPDDATLSDRELLKSRYAIRTVMDLRTKTEHQKQRQKRTSDLKLLPSILESNDAISEPMQIPGLNYLEMNINGKGFERSLLKKLSWWSFTKLILLMIIGRRTQAISILGREVMTPRGLLGLGHDTLVHCGPELSSALRIFASASAYPVLYHCTQGKDRTGLITILLLLLLDVPVDVVDVEYRLSERELLGERKERLKEIREMGFSDDFADCPRDFVREIEGFLQRNYGGVRSYLAGIGVTEAEMDAIVEVLSA